MPRSKRQDRQFRLWVQAKSAAYEVVWDRPVARHWNGPRDVSSVPREPFG
jgi:hypothetical protein